MVKHLRKGVACHVSLYRHFLEGRPFHILTNHKPLTFALNTRADLHSPCQATLGFCDPPWISPKSFVLLSSPDPH